MDLPGYVSVGLGTYGHEQCRFQRFADKEQIKVGKYCSIARGVEFLTGGGHNYKQVSTYPFPGEAGRSYHSTEDIVIGNDVWIGEGAKILGGTNVRDGSVIGAYSVTRGRFPSFTVIYGNPARPIRQRFHRDIIAVLLKIAWWNWPQSLIEERLEWFYKPVEEFVEEFYGGVR